MIDPAHQTLDIFDQDIVRAVWTDKYRNKEEATPYDSFSRVVKGLYRDDTKAEAQSAYDLMEAGIWMPAGRIQAGAGTDKRVTLINCYVMDTIADDMASIADVLKDSMLTMQQGGGIGLDFSTLRPNPAILDGTGSIASGPLPFMGMWDSMCKTIMSAGARRGAMMATLHCTHPSLPAFIEAKHKKGVLTHFNISILITDEFMEAVRSRRTWDLGFHKRPEEDEYLEVKEVDGAPWYVYSRWNAADLWDKIIESTYEYSEPGVIFIDAVNKRNNLKYCETIAATNPCGEQGLPPYGACNLGAINLARLVTKPFTDHSKIDFDLLRHAVTVGVRCLDNVLDVTIYPVEEQRNEALQKRRIGLGISGLANMLAELRIPYHHPKAAEVTKRVMSTIKEQAYFTSINLAKERGAFPLYDKKRFLEGAFIKRLNSKIRSGIGKNGIRNGVLLTIAPTGTTSIYYGNISSGLEPVFQFEGKRFVLQPDGSRKEYAIADYGWRLYNQVKGHNPDSPLPPYMCLGENLGVEDHLRIQAICQSQVDASISKTINCAEDITFAEFRDVYSRAFDLGCKGCTTYRPSETRGSIFAEETTTYDPLKVIERPDVLFGRTYRLRWPPIDQSLYVTINDGPDGRPFEIYITSPSAKYTEWTTALTLMITAIFRRGGNIDFIAETLKKVVSATDTAWIDGRLCNSLVAMIGETIERHMRPEEQKLTAIIPDQRPPLGTTASSCPRCNQRAFIHSEGCGTCVSCGFGNCG